MFLLACDLFLFILSFSILSHTPFFRVSWFTCGWLIINELRSRLFTIFSRIRLWIRLRLGLWLRQGLLLTLRPFGADSGRQETDRRGGIGNARARDDLPLPRRDTHKHHRRGDFTFKLGHSKRNENETVSSLILRLRLLETTRPSRRSVGVGSGKCSVDRAGRRGWERRGERGAPGGVGGLCLCLWSGGAKKGKHRKKQSKDKIGGKDFDFGRCAKGRESNSNSKVFRLHTHTFCRSTHCLFASAHHHA